MKVIGFVGSPRKNGNTDLLVQEILRGASTTGAETNIFYLNELNIKGCQDCNYCKENDRCKQQDDMQAIYDEISEADGIVIGSPVYMSYVTSQTKAFMDRCYALIKPDFTSKLGKDKKAVLVFAQGDPDEEQYKHIYASLADFPKSIGVVLQETLIAPGVRAAGKVSDDQKIMNDAHKIGERLGKVLRMAKVMKQPDAVSGPSKAKRPRS